MRVRVRVVDQLRERAGVARGRAFGEAAPLPGLVGVLGVLRACVCVGGQLVQARRVGVAMAGLRLAGRRTHPVTEVVHVHEHDGGRVVAVEQRLRHHQLHLRLRCRGRRLVIVGGRRGLLPAACVRGEDWPPRHVLRGGALGRRGRGLLLCLPQQRGRDAAADGRAQQGRFDLRARVHGVWCVCRVPVGRCALAALHTRERSLVATTVLLPAALS